jgi:ribonuclease HI
MSGEYRVKDEKLKELFAEARRLSRSFAVFDFAHVPRENNKDADRLANQAVDSFLGRPAPDSTAARGGPGDSLPGGKK